MVAALIIDSLFYFLALVQISQGSFFAKNATSFMMLSLLPGVCIDLCMA